jgi:hypothetical protein
MMHPDLRAVLITAICSALAIYTGALLNHYGPSSDAVSFLVIFFAFLPGLIFGWLLPPPGTPRWRRLIYSFLSLLAYTSCGVGFLVSNPHQAEAWFLVFSLLGAWFTLFWYESVIRTSRPRWKAYLETGLAALAALIFSIFVVDKNTSDWISFPIPEQPVGRVLQFWLVVPAWQFLVGWFIRKRTRLDQGQEVHKK